MKKIKPFLILSLLFFACENQNTEGKKLYHKHCVNCHQEGGKGVGKLIPPISGTFLSSHKEQLPCYIKNGLSGEIEVNGKTYNHEMPGNNKISDFDLVNILNYIEEKFGSGNKEAHNISSVRNSLSKCK